MSRGVVGCGWAVVVGWCTGWWLSVDWVMGWGDGWVDWGGFAWKLEAEVR